MGWRMDATHAFHFSSYHKQRDRYGICQRLSCRCIKLRDVLAGWHVGVVEGDDLSSLTTLIKLPFPLAHLLPCSNALTASSVISSLHHPHTHLLLLSPLSIPATKEEGVHAPLLLSVGFPVLFFPHDHQCHARNTQYLLKPLWASKIGKIASLTGISN